MALSNFSELKTSISSWLDEDALSLTVPDFITLAEAEFNRKLRVLEMETRATLDTVAGDDRYALPTGHLQTRRLTITTDSERSLEYITPVELVDLKPNSLTGEPAYFTIEDAEIRLLPTPASAYEMDQIYFKEITALSDSDPTNFLLTNHPDAYLYGSLVHAAPFLRDDERVAMWNAGYERAMEAIKKADIRRRFNSAPLRARSEVTRDTWKVRKGP